MIKNSRNKYLLKNTLIFTIGNFGTKIINFVLVPLYTNILSTKEYGTIDLLTVILTVIVPILTFNISESVMRFSLDKDVKKNDILNISIFLSIVSSILFLLLSFIFKGISLLSNYAILFSLLMITFSTSNIFSCYLRGKEKLLEFSLISIFQSFSIAILNIIFLIVFHMGIRGYLISYIISYVLTTLLCFIYGDIIRNYKKAKINFNLFKQMSKYSLLLIPNSLMWWIMNFLDRIMVSSMIGIEANGIYSVSYKIPSILITLTTIFNQAWMFTAVKEKNSNDKNEYTNSIYNSLFISVLFVATTLTLIIKPLIKIYVGSEFYQSWLYVPPLLIGTVFLTISTFLSNEYTVMKDSKGFLKSSAFGAVINLVLNFILIPIIGIMGASIATCISYIGVYAFRTFDIKKYLSIKYYNSKIVYNLIIFIMISLLIYIENILICIPIIILYIIMLFINKDVIKQIIVNILRIINVKLKRGKV